ncbi:GDSL-type esterase/lipase family protein [Anaerofustis sp. NSJ-163]|uniref:GDSL-type esterase/lipase family protein n=1 Tax=Anaerofustis sp. NSJ-163 TaxID=2944391 RepID=UPI00209C2CA2|nr:GDSL-type esterase/lipase family protein [Anaerofustis sp. NSJ-163]MCO8193576.1 GDSL-type esterase/lipase family protein [Anaerofustis sp. NSJ-163]
MKNSLIKKILSFSLAFFLVISFIPNEIKAAGEKNYLALGDSISTGYGLSQNGFVDQITDKYGYNLTNKADNGETSQSLLDKLNSNSLKSDIEDADVITLTIGGNDLMNALYDFLAEEYNSENATSYNGDYIKEELNNGNLTIILFAAGKISTFMDSPQAKTALSNFKDNLNDIISYIETNNPDAWIIITTQYNPYKFLPQQGQETSMATTLELINTTFEQGVQQLNQVIKKVNTSSSTFAVADVYERFNDANENPCNASFEAPLNLNLDFHPNAYGHELITDMIAGKIDELQFVKDQDEALNLLNPTLMKIMEMDELKTTSISEVKTKQQAKTWVENQIKPVLPNGMKVNVTILDFTSAKEGTKDNVKGTKGSFNLTVQLEYNGFYSEIIPIDTVIETTAYTNTSDNNNTKEEKDKNINTPNTSDENNVMPYVLLMIVSGFSITVLTTAIKKKYQ